MSRLAIDIGGTFTDVVLERDDGLFTTKVLTTHLDPADGVMDGLTTVQAEARCALDDVELVIHGTTLATNALIERRGAKTALLTTEGHRDVVEMAFENRFEQYDVNIDRPDPLVPRVLRLPVRERMGAAGNVLIDLDMETVDGALDDCDRRGVESIVVGFLHSYANPVHERTVAERIAGRGSDVNVTLSSEVCPEIREYERLSTACANGYVLPMMARYLQSLASRLAGAGCVCPYLMMTSGGGLTTFETASRFPIRLVESGPAGGAILAGSIARELGVDRLLSFDMGGTTAKICLIDGGQPQLSRSFEVDRRYRFKKGSGLPVRIPVIEMVEIGAGGGSIATIDKLKRIQVGPESAGSEPGPACYARGGANATVTDADAAMGRLDVDRFAGGRLKLDLDAARRVVQQNVGMPLQFEVDTAAFAVAEIVDENMAAAARGHAVEWGKSVEDRTLVAFGGAAPLHAARLGEKLGLARVIIPAGAGVGSALGFLAAPVSYEVVRSRYMRLSGFDASVVTDVLSEMRKEATIVVVSAAPGREVFETARAYMRYVGQGYEIAVEFDPQATDDETLQGAFDDAYRGLYDRLIPDLDVEILSWTLTVSTQPEGTPRTLREFTDAPAGATDLESTRQSVVEEGTAVEARKIDRRSLRPLERIRGPLLVVEDQTTTVVPSTYSIHVNERADLVLERVAP